jgi:polyribonucleotide nucleotidyltransferase
MGSVCGSTLALMDAGVPIKAPVAGIASGIMYEGPERYALLTDIQGPEDEYGDMDFKVAGTKTGITAVQMDVKVDGIPVPILLEALGRAREARLRILDVIESEISAPRSALSPRAPQIITTKIKPEQIGMVIGSAGKVINEIRELTATEIEIEDDGTVYITGKGEGPERARRIIEDMTHEYKPGERYTGTVTRLADFGAFVRLSPNAEGLVHISEIAPFRVTNIRELLHEGQKVPVMVKEYTSPNKISLSIKNAEPDFATKSKV